MGEKQTVSSSTTIAAAPEAVYALVSDLARMGEWSPENTGGSWVGGATGPVKGARFKGTNANGARTWSATVTITDATAPTRFAFVNKFGPTTFSEWTYEITPIDGGCEVIETWTDGRGPILSMFSRALTGVDDRVGHTRMMIETTLAKLKQTAEAGE